jgi:hypothetical protein
MVFSGGDTNDRFSDTGIDSLLTGSMEADPSLVELLDEIRSFAEWTPDPSQNQAHLMEAVSAVSTVGWNQNRRIQPVSWPDNETEDVAEDHGEPSRQSRYCVERGAVHLGRSCLRRNRRTAGTPLSYASTGTTPDTTERAWPGRCMWCSATQQQNPRH